MFFISSSKPFLKLILGLQLRSFTILEISAWEIVGSPGLFGTLTVLPPNNLVSWFIDLGLPVPTL